MIAPELAPGLIREVNGRIEASHAKINHDLKPTGYMSGIMQWAERASPWAERAIVSISGLPGWSLLLLPVAALLAGLAWKRRAGARAEAAMAAGASGFVGIVVTASAMIAFQTTAGSVYFAMAVLTAAFMIGLSAGARAWEALAERLGLASVLAGLAIVTWAAAAGVWLLVRSGPGEFTAAAGFCLILFMQGAASGALFPAAAARVIAKSGEVGAGTGLINGAEHIGSALGGALAGVILIPVFGLTGSILSAGLLALAMMPAARGGKRGREGL
jgi:hypothetical protein